MITGKVVNNINESTISDSVMDTLVLSDSTYLDTIRRVDYNSNISQVVTDLFNSVPYPSEVNFTRKDNSLATGVVTFANEEGKKYTVKFDVDGDAALYDMAQSLVMAQYRLMGHSDLTTEELYKRVHPYKSVSEAKELTKMEIPEGYEIIDKEYIGPVIDYECYIILCKKTLNDAFNSVQYVTWLLNDKGCHHGKYFWELKPAQKNFKDRVKEYKRSR